MRAVTHVVSTDPAYVAPSAVVEYERQGPFEMERGGSGLWRTMITHEVDQGPPAPLLPTDEVTRWTDAPDLAVSNRWELLDKIEGLLPAVRSRYRAWRDGTGALAPSGLSNAAKNQWYLDNYERLKFIVDNYDDLIKVVGWLMQVPVEDYADAGE